jgi:hypothetical protein
MNWFSASFRAGKAMYYPQMPFETWLEFFKAFNLYTPQVLLVLSIAACFYIVFKSIYLKKSLLLFNISKISIISGYIIIILYFIITKAGTSIDFQELIISILFPSLILAPLILIIIMCEEILIRRKKISLSASNDDSTLDTIYLTMALLPLFSLLLFIVDYNIPYY